MSIPVINGGVVPSATGVTLLARLRGGNGSLVTASTLSSISYTVYNITLGTTLGSGTFTISSSIYDSLQQDDPRWSVDSRRRPGRDSVSGYNFLATLPASLFAARTLEAKDLLAGAQPAPYTYQAEVKFTPTSGQPWYTIWRWVEEVVHG